MGGESMSMCEYCDVGDYYGTCKCTKTNELCMFVRRCVFEHKWLPIDMMDSCILREKKEIELMENEYIVRLEHKGELYVDMGEYTIKIKNPFDYKPDKVELVEVEGEYYIKGFEPKPKSKKTKKSKEE